MRRHLYNPDLEISLVDGESIPMCSSEEHYSESQLRLMRVYDLYRQMVPRQITDNDKMTLFNDELISKAIIKVTSGGMKPKNKK